jgi:hypothetical protein
MSAPRAFAPPERSSQARRLVPLPSVARAASISDGRPLLGAGRLAADQLHEARALVKYGELTSPPTSPGRQSLTVQDLRKYSPHRIGRPTVRPSRSLLTIFRHGMPQGLLRLSALAPSPCSSRRRGLSRPKPCLRPSIPSPRYWTAGVGTSVRRDRLRRRLRELARAVNRTRPSRSTSTGRNVACRPARAPSPCRPDVFPRFHQPLPFRHEGTFICRA